MAGKKRNFPPGIEVKQAFDLNYFLPYRIHRLAVKIGFVGRGTDSQTFRVLKLDDGELKAREWRVLAMIACEGPLTNTEIAEQACMETATVTRASKALNEKGLIQTKQLNNDKRKSLICFTKEGAELFDNLSVARQKQMDAIQSCLSIEEKELFYRILDKIDNQMQAQISQSSPSEVDWD